ncbi:MAG: hypothetical protein QXL51_00240 [Candidatus Aenigmatarchaeota archaeon]
MVNAKTEIKILDISKPSGLDLIVSGNISPIIVTGIVRVEEEDDDGEIQIYTYNWSATFMGNNPLDKSQWEIDIYEFDGNKEFLIDEIFEVIKDTYERGIKINEISLKEIIDSYTERVSTFSVTQPVLFEFLVDLGKEVSLKLPLRNLSEGERDSIIMEVVMQVLPNLKKKILDYFDSINAIMPSNEIELIEFIKNDLTLLNTLKGYLGSSLNSAFYSKVKHKPHEYTETEVSSYQPIEFEDIHDWAEKIFSYSVGEGGDVDEKNVIEDLNLAIDVLEKEEIERLSEKVRKRLMGSPNALKLFDKIIDIILNDFSEEDLVKLNEAGVVPDLYKQKTWSILTGIKDPVTISDSFGKIREAISLELKETVGELVDQKKVFEHFVSRHYNAIQKAKKLLSNPKFLDSFLTKFSESATSTEWNAFYDYIVEGLSPEEIISYYKIDWLDLTNIIEKGLSFV